MSRIGRLPIPVPAGVDISVDGAKVSVKGPKGSLSREIAPQLTIVGLEDDAQRLHRLGHAAGETAGRSVGIGDDVDVQTAGAVFRTRQSIASDECKQ